MKPQLSHRSQWVIGAALLGITLCWCVAAGHVIYYAGDSMIGFHPLLLFQLPYAGVLGLAAVVGCALRRWRLAAMAAASVLAVLVFITQGYRIGLWAWSRSIRQYDLNNREVIDKSAAIPELTDETLMDSLWRGEALPVLEGFKWYCEHHLASPGGAVRAFRYRGSVHVRIQKIRHGYRGIALTASPGDKGKLERDSQLIYEEGPPIGSGWVIWRSY